MRWEEHDVNLPINLVNHCQINIGNGKIFIFGNKKGKSSSLIYHRLNWTKVYKTIVN